jgi:GxxExxY protein
VKGEGDAMNEEDYKHAEITGKIIGCAMEVHGILGNGFQELIYQRALSMEMKTRGIDFIREQELDIFYKGVVIGTRRVDFFVGDKVMVEIKAIEQLEDIHLAQAINYLEAYNVEVGLLLNFGSKSLEYKRLLKRRSR